jgi:hypothetical protein
VLREPENSLDAWLLHLLSLCHGQQNTGAREIEDSLVGDLPCDVFARIRNPAWRVLQIGKLSGDDSPSFQCVDFAFVQPGLL